MEDHIPVAGSSTSPGRPGMNRDTQELGSLGWGEGWGWGGRGLI